MQIATWNVNSIRTRLDQVIALLNETQIDLLCLQETKVDDPLFPTDAFESKGYRVKFYGQKSYNGVALVSRKELSDVRYGLEGELPLDEEARELGKQKRVISALIEDIRVVNLYVPNGSDLKSDKYKYKLSWLKCLKRYLLEQAKRNEPLCLLGDFNIALEDRDIHNPDRLSGGIMASAAERESLQRIISNDLKDVFRIFESESNHWSWWDYRSGGWERDRGWRIDHIYLSEELLSQAKGCNIYKTFRGNPKPSDHAPVLLELKWPEEENEEEGEEDMDLLYM
ncbi:exodeoxyribonuclease III [Prochlorococcus sp. MIT 1341]|uniref:exodeoxyribonuclease III n=1 Tax=Prochlorococcus sp. MIT 1341 TaxID=3096221 RepID=UPI002A749CC4|nr:exodeoxyribonuclease III [Prochlorococcus sp. MIT 1341]